MEDRLGVPLLVCCDVSLEICCLGGINEEKRKKKKRKKKEGRKRLLLRDLLRSALVSLFDVSL